MIEFKYREDELVNELMEYIRNTYNQHYVNESHTGENTVQYLDSVFSKPNGRGLYFCVDTAGKYLDRFGVKDGKNRKDIMKALHYLILALYNLDKDENFELDQRDLKVLVENY